MWRVSKEHRKIVTILKNAPILHSQCVARKLKWILVQLHSTRHTHTGEESLPDAPRSILGRFRRISAKCRSDQHNFWKTPPPMQSPPGLMRLVMDGVSCQRQHLQRFIVERDGRIHCVRCEDNRVPHSGWSYYNQDNVFSHFQQHHPDAPFSRTGMSQKFNASHRCCLLMRMFKACVVTAVKGARN